MRKPVTFRFDSELLERARRHASADNRSLTNYVETAVRRALAQTERVPSEPSPSYHGPAIGKEDDDT
jgi:hypothetical protein